MKSPATKTPRLLYVLGATMALGPLAALTIGSHVADPEAVARANLDAAPAEVRGLAAHDGTRTPATYAQGTDIMDVVRGSATYEAFYDALRSAELAEKLAQGGPYTVFVPTREAFDQMIAQTASAGGESGEALRELVQSHIVAGRVSATDLMRQGTLTAINGKQLALATTGDVRVNNASVVATENAANGVVHVVDAIL